MDKQKLKAALKFYAITDRTWLGNREFKDDVEKSIKGGVTILQVREKNINDDEFVKTAKEIKKLTDKYKIPLIINDNVKVAALIDADGIHVGQDDAKMPEVKKILGEGKIIGVSVATIEEALLAQQEGADYLGVGAMFNTSTKTDADSVSFETLKEICDNVDIPVVAIGGINDKNILKLKGTNIDGACVISAIYSKQDIFTAASNLRKLCDTLVEG